MPHRHGGGSPERADGYTLWHRDCRQPPLSQRQFRTDQGPVRSSICRASLSCSRRILRRIALSPNLIAMAKREPGCVRQGSGSARRSDMAISGSPRSPASRSSRAVSRRRPVDHDLIGGHPARRSARRADPALLAGTLRLLRRPPRRAADPPDCRRSRGRNHRTVLAQGRRVRAGRQRLRRSRRLLNAEIGRRWPIRPCARTCSIGSGPTRHADSSRSLCATTKRSRALVKDLNISPNAPMPSSTYLPRHGAGVLTPAAPLVAGAQRRLTSPTRGHLRHRRYRLFTISWRTTSY